MSDKRSHAVVLGGSVAGLAAARVLHEVFDQVTIYDRDEFPEGGEQRRGVPQAEHAHGLLARGRAVLEELFPGTAGDLAELGALPLDVQRDVVWVFGEQAAPRVRSGIDGLAVSRALLEGYLRRRVRALPNVVVRDRHEVTGLLFDGAKVTGVTVGGREQPADLVVDATGRGNRGPVWLRALGFEAPAEERIDAGTVYVSRDYRRTPGREDFVAVLNAPNPRRPHGGIALGVDGDRWMVTLLGVGKGEEPPVDHDGYTRFAAKLPDPRLHRLLEECEPLNEPMRLRLPGSVRRRYERVARLPERLVSVGDALCSFNPAYAQGMTVAVAEALVLRDALQAGLGGLPRRFYARAAKVIDVPWDMSAGGDLAYPHVEGVRTRRTELLNAYVARVQAATGHDAAVARRFLEVTNLVRPPQSLMAPGVLAKAFKKWPTAGTAQPRAAADRPAVTVR